MAGMDKETEKPPCSMVGVSRLYRYSTRIPAAVESPDEELEEK